MDTRERGSEAARQRAKAKIRIPVASPLLSGREVDYLTDCIQSGWISSQGGYVDEFEKKFASYCGCKHGIATNSGTTALHLALAAAGVGPGDEVLLPTFTMIACPNAVSYCGAKPSLVDAEAATWNLDSSKIEGKIGHRTKAVMPVHTYGHPVQMEPILDIAERRGLVVVEDCAEAHGAEYRGRRVGSLGDLGCFSFYANKIITTGEGGMIVTNNDELAERARWLRAHAFGKGGKHFWHEAIGFGYRLSALQAAVGLAQLEKIDEFVESRRKHARLYNSLLGDIEGIRIPPEASWAKSVYWMYSVLVDRGFGVSRDDLMKKLENCGIETRTFFYPIHRQPAYSKSYEDESFPIADELSQKGINLPSGNSLTEQDIQYVTECIRSCRDQGSDPA
jgi:perosamine synthetase